MFKKIADAFKVKDIRHRILFVLLCLVVIRVGSQIPVPGVDANYFSEWFASQAGDAFNFFDAFTGGSFSSMAGYGTSAPQLGNRKQYSKE